MTKYKTGPIEPKEPMRKWEQLVKEHFELLADEENDTSARRQEIHQQLQQLNQEYRKKHPEFFRLAERDRSDDEFER